LRRSNGLRCKIEKASNKICGFSCFTNASYHMSTNEETKGKSAEGVRLQRKDHMDLAIPWYSEEVHVCIHARIVELREFDGFSCI
jgi:hypothetical protein